MIEDVGRNAEVVRALGMTQAMARRWDDVAEKLRAHQHLSSSRTAWLVSWTKAVRMAVQMGIMGLGAYLAIKNEITVGAMFATSILLGRVLAPFEQVLATQQRAVEPLPRQPHETVIAFESSVGPAPSPSDGSSVSATNV